MGRVKRLIRNCISSVTIMVVPHTRLKPLRIRVSMLTIACCLFLSCVGAGYIVSSTVKLLEYHAMKRKVALFASQIVELKIVTDSLRKANSEVVRLVSLNSRKKILEMPEQQNEGSLNVDLLKEQVQETIQSIAEIREFISQEKDVYRATPTGWPIKGQVSSPFGVREHPISGDTAFHSGIDLRAPQGTEVKATADGIVSFSNWHYGSGNIVVVEHGHGFSTVYAHNKTNLVKLGQKVTRGQAIALSGSTGASTGPHLHYEVWRNRAHVNPAPYLEDKS